MEADAERRRRRAPLAADLVRRMTSRKKIEANRRNAKKSTGPKTERGKMLARFNALVNGLYSPQRVLPWEDKEGYDWLAIRTHAQFDPVGPIEEALVSQIIGDMWRLTRVEKAERVYLDQAQASHLMKMIQSLSDQEFHLMTELYGPLTQVTKPPDPTERTALGAGFFFPGKPAGSSAPVGFTDQDVRALKEKIGGLDNLGTVLLEAMIPRDEKRPMAEIDRIREKLMRNMLRNHAALTEIQERRLTVLSNVHLDETNE